MRKLFIAFISLIFTISVAYSQTISAADIIQLVSSSSNEAAKFMINERKFKHIASPAAQGVSLEQFTNNTKSYTEIIMISQWQDEERRSHHFVHYDVRPKTYAPQIIKQFEELSFKLKSQVSEQFSILGIHFRNNLIFKINFL
jgi:hypothetical protein